MKKMAKKLMCLFMVLTLYCQLSIIPIITILLFNIKILLLFSQKYFTLLPFNILILFVQFLIKNIKYLPGRGDTMIEKVVFPGRDLSIALWMC